VRRIILFLILSFHSYFSHASFLPPSFSSDYEESYLSTTQKKEVKSSGKIDYKFPHQIRFEVIKPDSSIFVSNADKSWYYTPPFIEGEEGQVVIQKSNELVLVKLLDELKEGLVSNKNYDVKFLKNEAQLIFKEKRVQELKVNKVVLKANSDASKIKTFDGFSGIDLFYTSGQVIHLVFKNLKTNAVFPDNHFIFNIPKNTKISP
jgi:outer membrane lipoprotein-sorting protein